MFILYVKNNNGWKPIDEYTADFSCGYRARLAQSVERWTFNPTVVGSSPTSGDAFE